MSERIVASSLLIFGLLTLALIINMTTLQSGTRSLAPAPLAVAAANSHATLNANDLDQTKQFVLLNANPNAQTASEVQRELKALGYAPGSSNGTVDLKTQAAVMAFEYDNGLPMTAKADASQLQRLLLGLGQSVAGKHDNARVPTTDDAGHVMRTVQQSLASLNYDPGPIDGKYGSETSRAIRNFELDNNLPETGRVSGRLIDAMAARMNRS